MPVDYEEFVAAKAVTAKVAGIEVGPGDVHEALYLHQRDLVRWAAAGGCRAIFAAFGLGKSLMQLSLLDLIARAEGGPVLIVCPLGVRQEFARDAELLGIVTKFIRSADEIDRVTLMPQVHLTNYETIRDGKLDPNLFVAISLDEASVLRSLGSKTTRAFIDGCRDVRYRFVATATPSPNEFTELLHYAEFLGVMDKGQALTRWFKRDSTKAGHLTLHPHKEREFWLWLSSWAVFLQRPSDLGYSDDGYVLPDIEVVYHEVPIDHLAVVDVENTGQAILMRGGQLGVVQASREKRITMDARVAETAGIIAAAGPDEHFVIWHDLEDERKAIRRAVPDAVEVYGSLDLDERERRIIDFSEGRTRILATKPTISGSGCNFQRHCHRAIYTGIGFNFNDFVQSIHRIQRFQQPHPVRVDVIYAESEREVLATLQRKWREHNDLTTRMSELIREHGLARDAIERGLTRTMGIERQEATGVGWLAANNDCVDEVQQMGDDSVDLVVTSIPFANHYEYSPSYNDFGHTDDNAHFWAQMDYLSSGLYRTVKPGRIFACHVKDRIVFGNMTGAGFSTVSPFHAEAIAHYRSHGFEYCGLIVVVTDVVSENNQSYRLSYSEMLKDGTKMGVGSPEFVLLFRKPQTDKSKGYADQPVVHDPTDYSLARWQVDAHAFWRSSGDRHLTPDEWANLPADQLYATFRRLQAEQVYDFDEHVAIGEALASKDQLSKRFMMLAPPSAHPDVWTDINRMRTLNGEQARRNVEQHVCPLQFDIVDRLIERFSNPDEEVFDPFGGLSTVAVRALKLGRRGRTVELNPQYWHDAVKYLEAEERRVSMPSLFDLEPPAQEAS